ncbi:MAG: AMP-binding protein [Pseudomonadota bacterium]|nr:AMP-binding protein [Pseudomonadota bacterium]
MSKNPGTFPSASFDAFCRRIDRQLTGGGDQLFAELDDGNLSYSALAADIGRLGAAFTCLGLTVGNRAVVFSRHDRSTITLFLALLRAGLTPVVADGRATAGEIGELIRTCRPAIVFADADVLAASTLRATFPWLPAVEIGPTQASTGSKPEPTLAALPATQAAVATASASASPEVAMLVFTSGTTSAPKAVELTHANLLAQLEIFAAVYGFDADSRLLNLLPLHHVDGLIRGPLTALWFGGSVHRALPFSVANVPALLTTIAAQHITHFISVPAMLRIVERVGSPHAEAFRTPQFRFVLCSADHLDAVQWARFEATFGVAVVNAYGLSEVVCDALFAGPGAATRRIGSLGLPAGCVAEIRGEDGLSVAPGEVGELVISGPTVMRGYFDAPELTASVLRNGVFQTGDYFRVAEDGLFEFVGRKKTAIVSAGVTLHPESIASVLATMPGVAEAVAFGVIDAGRGERLVAALAPVPAQQITPAAAAAFCRVHLAPERVPAEFLIVDALPRNPAGKVLLKDLVASVAARPLGIGKPDVWRIAARCFNCAVESLTAESTPFNTDGWDSLAHMSFIEELESAFDIRFSATQITQIMSLGDAETVLGVAWASANL